MEIVETGHDLFKNAIIFLKNQFSDWTIAKIDAIVAFEIIKIKWPLQILSPKPHLSFFKFHTNFKGDKYLEIFKFHPSGSAERTIPGQVSWDLKENLWFWQYDHQILTRYVLLCTAISQNQRLWQDALNWIGRCLSAIKQKNHTWNKTPGKAIDSIAL